VHFGILYFPVLRVTEDSVAMGGQPPNKLGVARRLIVYNQKSILHTFVLCVFFVAFTVGCSGGSNPMQPPMTGPDVGDGSPSTTPNLTDPTDIDEFTREAENTNGIYPWGIFDVTWDEGWRSANSDLGTHGCQPVDV